MNKIIVIFSSLSNRQKMIGGGIAVVVLLLLCIWIFAGVAMPDPKTGSQKDIANYLASDSFGKLKSDQKMAYMEKLRARSDFKGPPQGLTDAQQQAIRRNMGDAMRDRMEKEMEEYAKLSPAEQTAFLDKKIDEMEAMRKNGPPPGAPTSQPGAQGQPPQGQGQGGPPGGGPGGGGSPGAGGSAGRDRMTGMLSNSSPKQRATMMKFMDAMRKRMKERGISMPEPPKR
jgi:uncharacterized membrane protein YgcG